MCTEYLVSGHIKEMKKTCYAGSGELRVNREYISIHWSLKDPNWNWVELEGNGARVYTPRHITGKFYWRIISPFTVELHRHYTDLRVPSEIIPMALGAHNISDKLPRSYDS